MSHLLDAPLPLFVVQAALVIVTSRTLGATARRFGQPLVVAEITAGILLGPSLLGWLLPDLEAAVFPAKSMPTLGLLSQIGLILFMFLVGLEFDPKLLRGRTRSSIAISHSSIVVPFGLGAILAWYLYKDHAPAGVPMTSFVLFMGTAMSITAFPVLARILTERGMMRSKVGTIAITCAAVDDVTAWCILAFVVSVARATSLGAAVQTSVLAILYIALMFIAAKPLLRRWLDTIHAGLSQNLVAAALVLLLLSSWVTELIGIHALFGAFLFGVVLPKENNIAAKIAHKLGDLVVVFMLPLFFAYSGLRTQIGLLNTGESWIVCACIVALACIGKFGGSAVAAKVTGLSWRESSAIGVLMNTRGLMELVVLNIGLDLGVISPALFTMMVIMALVTTFLTTPLLQRIYPIEELANESRVASTTEAGPASGNPSTPGNYVAVEPD